MRGPGGATLALVGVLFAALAARAQPTTGAWRVVVVHEVSSDPGNGTTLGSSRTTITITPQAIVVERDDEARGRRPSHTRRTAPAPSAQLQAEIVSSIAALPTDGRCYALSPSVPDEGSDGTSLTVFDGTTTRVVCIQNGRASPAAPPALARLVELVMSAS